MPENLQIILGISAAALPTITVLVGILLNRSEYSRLDARITAFESSLRAEFRAEFGTLRGEIAAMRAQFHSDVLMLLSSDKEQDQRITRLENR